MKIGLVSYRCENQNLEFNLLQVRRALEETAGRVDLLCFGEAFLQGFDSLCWQFEQDRRMALDQDSDVFHRLCRWSEEFDTAILTGYIERAEDRLYSSCAVVAQGQVLHNYRRITPGWREADKTDEHYGEGTQVQPFCLRGKEILLGLCGDLWDSPQRFLTPHLLIWPVYVNYSLEAWEQEMLRDYARHAAELADDVLMVNPLDHYPVSHGGAFRFQKGEITAGTPFDEERILIVDVA